FVLRVDAVPGRGRVGLAPRPLPGSGNCSGLGIAPARPRRRRLTPSRRRNRVIPGRVAFLLHLGGVPLKKAILVLAVAGFYPLLATRVTGGFVRVGSLRA